MWELEFFIPSKDKKCLYNIYNTFKTNKKPFKPILAFTDNGQKCTLSVACSKENAVALLAYTKEVLATNIVTYYKKVYFDSKIMDNHLNNDLRKVVIDAVIRFDLEDDIILCQACLDEIHFLHIDSFFHFRLRPLIQKWEQLYNIIADVLCVGLTYEGYLELLRFLVSMNISTNIVAEMYCEKDRIIIKDSQKVLYECEPRDYEILGRLVNISPKYINVYSANNLDNNIIKSISYIWSKRVNILV